MMQDHVFFESFATGSKRTFSLRAEDITWKKLSLFAAIAQDGMQIRNASGELVDLHQLETGSRYTIEKKAAVEKPSSWIEVCSISEFEARRNKLGAVRLGIDGRDVMILEKKGAWFAFDAVCYHFGGPLMDGSLIGDIEDLQIVW